MPSPVEWLQQLPPLGAYALLAGLVCVEGVLVVSPFVPTLGPLLIAGALCYAGTLEPWWVVLAAATGAVAGDAQGFWAGRWLGPRLRAKRSKGTWDRAEAALRRYGGPAMVPCRFVPLVRSAVPHLIGASGSTYRRMAPFSLLAAVVWACGEGGVGYLAGASLGELSGVLGVLPVVALVLVVTVGVVIWRRRVRRARRTEQDREPEHVP